MFSRGNQSSSALVSFLAYDEIDDAVRIANESDLSLSGTVFSAGPERGYMAVADRSVNLMMRT